MTWKDLVDQAKSVVMEDEPTKVHTSSTPATPPPAPAPVVPITSAPILTESVPVATEAPDSEMYQRLVEKTNWENSPVFQAIKKHLAPLKGMALDPKTKFSVALAQAKDLDGVDPAAVTQAFEDAKSNLTAQLNNFRQIVANKMATEVETKQAKAKELQTQAQQLNEEAFAAQQKLQAQQHKFEIAATQRQTEINQKQAEYNSLLS